MHDGIAAWVFNFCDRQSGVADTPPVESTVSARMTQSDRQPTASDAATAWINLGDATGAGRT
jgi:hypothetical protein